jgi:hypothetical protein
MKMNASKWNLKERVVTCLKRTFMYSSEETEENHTESVRPVLTVKTAALSFNRCWQRNHCPLILQ